MSIQFYSEVAFFQRNCEDFQNIVLSSLVYCLKILWIQQSKDTNFLHGKQLKFIGHIIRHKLGIYVKPYFA